MSYPKQPNYPRQPSLPSLPDSVSAVVRSELLQAIDQNNVKVCDQLIQNDPRRVHETGWNDLTPVHQVCLRGQVEILQLLMHHQAKLDAKSAFGETPLHYACRRGDVRIIHMLIKAGCDVTAVDKQGRGCVHFVAIGGNVPAMHYLEKQTDLPLDAIDDIGETALHIACTHRHFFLVHYLLRNGRSNPKQQNKKGATVLHIAAQMGNGEVVWKLLNNVNCSLLHIQDNDGMTPTDLAKKEVTVSHKQVASSLEYYSKQNPNLPPEGPKFTWYFLLLLPFIWAAIVFLISSFFNSHSGHFAVAMFILLVFFVYRQSHRIHHAARWPNPIFLGAFAGGIFHCLIAAYVKVVIGMWPCPFTALSVALLTCTLLYSLRHLVRGDPGFVTRPCHDNGHQMTVLDIAVGRCKESDFCPYTEIIRPERTKYCRLCERLLADLDHHCLFIMNCVARDNHRLFVLFILNVMVMQVYFIIEAYIYTDTFYPNSIVQSIMSLMFHYEPWLFDLCLLCCLAFLWECSLMFMQFKNIIRGQTVYYSSRQPPRISFSDGVRNVIRFFLHPKRRFSLPEKRPF